jgi:membrane protease YdiL (CAAX protease family)
MLVGTIWGLWHIGHFKNGLLFMLGFLLFTISASILIAWVLRNTRFSLLLSVLFHVSINMGFFVYFQYSINDQYLMVINGIVWMIPAILIGILSGKNLTRKRKLT